MLLPPPLLLPLVMLLLLLRWLRMTCPNCLTLPAITLLQKISSHLDMVRPDAKLQETDERQVGVQGCGVRCRSHSV